MKIICTCPQCKLGRECEPVVIKRPAYVLKCKACGHEFKVKVKE